MSDVTALVDLLLDLLVALAAELFGRIAVAFMRLPSDQTKWADQ